MPIIKKNLFIPIKEIKGNIASLAAETSGIVLIESFVKIFVPPNKIAQGITEFTLKNLVSFLIYSISNIKQNKDGEQYKYDFYYISASLTF